MSLRRQLNAAREILKEIEHHPLQQQGMAFADFLKMCEDETRRVIFGCAMPSRFIQWADIRECFRLNPNFLK